MSQKKLRTDRRDHCPENNFGYSDDGAFHRNIAIASMPPAGGKGAMLALVERTGIGTTFSMGDFIRRRPDGLLCDDAKVLSTCFTTLGGGKFCMARRVFMEGVPRTGVQADGLFQYLLEQGDSVRFVVRQVSDEVLRARFTERWRAEEQKPVHQRREDHPSSLPAALDQYQVRLDIFNNNIDDVMDACRTHRVPVQRVPDQGCVIENFYATMNPFEWSELPSRNTLVNAARACGLGDAIGKPA